ncbi:MAG: hypothetical protein HY584_01240, partial [Candidatus Omnitrophica bacterium]|nr:hypothetical protein [Candidatus Omnitrophota bacterium]
MKYLKGLVSTLKPTNLTSGMALQQSLVGISEQIEAVLDEIRDSGQFEKIRLVSFSNVQLGDVISDDDTNKYYVAVGKQSRDQQWLFIARNKSEFLEVPSDRPLKQSRYSKLVPRAEVFDSRAEARFTQPESPERGPLGPSRRAEVRMSTTAVDQLADQLMEQFRTDGLLSDPTPLFKKEDPIVLQLFQEILTEQPAEIISRDTTSWEEITQAVAAHLEANPGRALIIIEGAATHIWGAILHTERNQKVRYISATKLKLDAETVRDKTAILPKDKEEDKVRQKLKAQLKRSVGVIKHLGYDSLEAFVRDRHQPKDAHHLMVGLEETGYHYLYSDTESDHIAFDRVTQFLDSYKPQTILYIREDLAVENLKKIHAGLRAGNLQEVLEKDLQGAEYDPLPRDQFLLEAEKRGIKVTLAAFGWKDRIAKPRAEVRNRNASASAFYQKNPLLQSHTPENLSDTLKWLYEHRAQLGNNSLNYLILALSVSGKLPEGESPEAWQFSAAAFDFYLSSPLLQSHTPENLSDTLKWLYEHR